MNSRRTGQDPLNPPALHVVIGLGANLGDRLATMRGAAARIESLEGVRVRARSRLYETAPVGGPAQGAFLNAALALDCRLAPLVLLEELQAIERQLGRSRGAAEVRWGPRTIDLDVLWIAELRVDEARLQVPHPRLATRGFALVPLLEVAPGAVDPSTGEPYVVTDDAGVRLTTWTW